VPAMGVGCLTVVMTPSGLQSVQVEAEVQMKAASVVLGVGLMMEPGRSPGQSSPRFPPLASATFPSPDLKSPPVLARLVGMSPSRCVAASGLSCGPVADLTAPCYARRAATEDAVMSLAAELAAAALLLFSSVAIPLVRKRAG
jgi:hypothetical protein